MHLQRKGRAEAGDRFSPKKLISAGLLTTIIMNILFPLCTDLWQIVLVWSINGFAQAFMWPPLVRLMVLLLSPEEYKIGVVRISWGSSLGAIIIYLAAPLLIILDGYQCVFFFSGTCGLLMLFVWLRFCPETAFCLLLWLLYGTSPILSVLLVALLTGCMHGVNLMLTCMVPPFYAATGKVSTVSGIINSCIYIGNAASTYGTASLAEYYDWRRTFSGQPQ